jgi:imidazolonepropionase-like amidohydrolase
VKKLSEMVPAALLLLAACGAPRGSMGPVPSIAGGESPAVPADLLVLRGRVIDGTGAPPLENGVVIVQGERIRCVGGPGECRYPGGARVISAGGGTILPGLIDLHTHARPHYLGWFLPSGVTSIRDASNHLPMIEALHAVGPYRPRIFWSGPLLDGERTVMKQFGAEGVLRPAEIARAFALEVTTPEEAREAVDSLVARGASVIKLYEQLSPEVFAAATERAREREIRTMTDLGMQVTRGLRGSEVDALQAMAAGVTSIEHASGFALAYQRLGGDPTRTPFDAALVDSLARAAVRHGVAVVPTLMVFYHDMEEAPPSLDGIPMADRVPAEMREWMDHTHASSTPAVRERSRRDYLLTRAVVTRMAAMGGRIGAGSDTPAGSYNIPGGSLHQELELLVGAGLTPLQAIHAATGAAAEILGESALGVLAAGRRADLIVVDGNPAVDIRSTRHVRLVVQDGQIRSQEELLAALDGAGEPEPLVVPFGRAPSAGGPLDPAEWADAGHATIQVEPGWTVGVRYLHDEANLYVAFTDLKRGGAERYPEVLIGTGAESVPAWQATDHWLHASYQNCDASGESNDYGSCAPTRPGWSANRFPLAEPATIVMRISYERLGIVPGRDTPIRIAFNVTDTRERWHFWPEQATLESPGGWATAISRSRWGRPDDLDGDG